MLHKRILLQLQWLIFSSFKWWGNVLAVSVKVSRYGWRAALNHSHVSTQLMVHQRLNMSVVRMTTATRDLFQNLIQSQNHCKVWQHDPDGLFTIICIFLSRNCAAPPYWLIRSKAQSRPTIWTLHDLHLVFALENKQKIPTLVSVHGLWQGNCKPRIGMIYGTFRRSVTDTIRVTAYVCSVVSIYTTSTTFTLYTTKILLSVRFCQDCY